MQIIDKHKDYYDYLSHIYGQDKTITFDRRGSIVLNDLKIPNELKVLLDYRYVNDIEHIILEIGYVQYLIELSDFKFEEPLVPDVLSSYKMKLVHVYHDNKHYSNSPISIYRVYLNRIFKRYKNSRWDGKHEYIITNNFKETIRSISTTSIDLPILADTQITSLIPADKVWKEMQNYISSLNNDKNIDIPMTDIDKAENHGFDKKTSFRHPIK